MSVEKVNDPDFENIVLSDYGEDDEEEEDTGTDTTIDEELEEVSQRAQEGREKVEEGQELDEGRTSETEKIRKDRLSKSVTALYQQDKTTPKEPSWSFSSDSSEVFLPSGPFIVRKKLPAKKDFFQILGHLPDIDQISLPESLKREQLGEEVGSSEGEGEEGEGTEPQAAEIISDEVKESTTTEYSEFEFISSESEEEDAEKKVSDAHLFDALTKEDAKTALIIEEFDYESWQRKEAERQVMRDTQVFLKSLIEYVVEFAEYVDPKTLLRQSLNKNKLFHKVVRLLGDMQVERKVGEFLQRKCIDYYRRQKMLRPISPDAADMLAEEMERCKVNYETLDCLLGRESATKEIVTKRIAELEAEEIRLKEQIERETVATEYLIRSTIRRRGSDRLNVLAERKIKEMAALRPEITAVRSMLIQRQHTMAKLKEKAAAAEDLGGGLYMHDFYRLENETFALGRKLEEHAYYLHRIRNRYYTFTDIAAHLREKQTMMILSLRVQKSTLRNAQIDRDSYREHIHNLKLSRMRVQNQIRELSFKNGLIARPALMLDYDNTTEKVGQEKAKVDKMKADLAKINKKIDRLEKPSNCD